MDTITIVSWVIAVVVVVAAYFGGRWLLKNKESLYLGLLTTANTTFETYGNIIKERDEKLYDALKLALENLNKIQADTGQTMDEFIRAFQEAWPLIQCLQEYISGKIDDVVDRDYVEKGEAKI